MLFDRIPDAGVRAEELSRTQLARGLASTALLAGHGLTALGLSLLNIVILAAIRVYDVHLRSRERRELARLKLELEAARRDSGG